MASRGLLDVEVRYLDEHGDAVAGRRRHPTDTDLLTLTRQFWERFTGGNIAYAPEALQLDPANPTYADYRRTNPLLHVDLFHVAHMRLRTQHHIEGPLRWTPAALPPPGDPGIWGRK